ncbi:MAG TPA: RsmB/NOP family class I SAM-dependent RNA methyltransferase, partial [Longimicrobiales bacterium]|nr:RsmB/NOP family class I SAM-dependent RNA methyltransferase [Longimicrobiales bacterium]
MAAARRRRRSRAVDLARYRSIIPDWAAFTASAGRPEPTVFRVRTGRVDESALLDRLGRQGFRLTSVEGLPTFYRVDEGPHPISMTFEHWAGLIYVQQASTGVAAPQLGVSQGERVLDLCSAPGGKTSHLAELMGDRGCLVASEIDERRIRGLLGNIYRLGHPNALAVACDGRHVPEGALFDRVLVDAPCSGEGTLRRRSGEAPNQSRSFLKYVTRLQQALLEKAVRLCRPGGTILYVTCTFSPDENEAVVSNVLERSPVDLEPLELEVPHAAGLTSFEGVGFDARLQHAARIYPHHFDSGGLFVARLRRLEGEAAQPGRDVGWSPIPRAFPGDGVAEESAGERVSEALEELVRRYGIPTEALERYGWTLRGGRVWAHSADEWPLRAWAAGPWRPVSVGVRAIEFD